MPKETKWFPAYLTDMGNLLHSLGFSALLFALLFLVVFLYQWMLFLYPQNNAIRHFQAKHYEEAVRIFQQVLKRRPPSGIEADTRRRLADKAFLSPDFAIQPIHADILRRTISSQNIRRKP